MPVRIEQGAQIARLFGCARVPAQRLAFGFLAQLFKLIEDLGAAFA
jgi:hypothetical protein